MVLSSVWSLAQYPKKVMHAAGGKKIVGQIKNTSALTFIFPLKAKKTSK